MPPNLQNLADTWAAFAGSAWPWVCLGILGASMLLAGERLLRPALTLGTVLTTITTGVLCAKWLAGAGGASPGQLAAGGCVGLVAGVALAAGIVRLAISVAAGTSFACAGVLIAGAWLLPRDASLHAASQSAASAADITASDAAEFARTAWQSDGTGVKDLAAATAHRAGEEGFLAWNTISAEGRLTLVGAAATGALCGLLLGGLMPRKAGAAVTGLAGAAMLLAAATGLAWSRGWIDGPPNVGPGAVLTAWLGLAVAGAGAQMWWQRRLSTPPPAPVAA